MPDDKKTGRAEYVRAYWEANKERLRAKNKAYYEANKERLNAKRAKQPRTAVTLAAEQRYRDKKRLLREIAEMPSGPVWGIE